MSGGFQLDKDTEERMNASYLMRFFALGSLVHNHSETNQKLFKLGISLN